ncbi:MAG TPA: hypothetical protein VGJ84_04810, partial [Polyangiaceae bacterium]
NEKKLQACCTLNRIAFNGGTNRAYFATTKQELRSQLSNILSANAPTTSRTQPAFAASSSVRDPFAGSYRFFSSFKPKQLSLWSGVLERERFICKKDPGTGKVLPESQGIRSELGDDFIANVNSGAGPARLFVSAAGTLANGVIHSERSIRPTYPGSNPDGTGVYVGSQYQGDPATFTSNTPPESMAITSTTCAGLSASQCRDLYMRWNVGLNNGTQYQRCSAPGTSTCNLIADIFHSTPRLVNHPQEFIRDESYTAFSASKAPRPLMLYASSNDGVLHAFKVAPNDPADLPVNTLSNNELWAFIPPAVLPLIPSQYPNAHQILLDGVPVIKDVAAVDTGGGNFVFERSGTQAQSGSGTWRTVLVQSFGGARGGYFALDITDPVPGNTGGPRFLWQLTQDASGNPLFGLKGGTPLVTTLFFDVGGGEIKEVPVAILPGGDGGTPTGASCARKQTSYSNVDSGYQPRSNVNCYPVAGIGGRSLTVARLDTGEIIRSFRNSAADAPASLAGRVTETVIDSPITGQPVPFPAETGAVADRIYIGDQDGTLWKLDVSSTDSTKWKMELIFDAYPSSLSHAFGDGQPIATPPILSVDESGNITAAISTGDQEVFTSSSSVNYVWSFTEKPNASGTGLVSKVNWYKKFTSGERVTGPMTLFNRGLYFSTFQPASSAAACSVGASALWGMDYLTKSTAGIDQGGLEVLPDPADPTKQVQRIDVSALLNQPNGTVFGVGITQQPTCDSVDTGFNDPFLGFGAHTALTNVEPGKFQLVAQTGGAGTPITGGSTNALTVDLATPSLTAQVDSWAAIIE